MPPLPNGWCDTGIVHTQTLSIDCQIRTIGDHFAHDAPFRAFEVEGWILGSNPSAGADLAGCPAGTLGAQYGMNTSFTAFIVQDTAGFGTRTDLDTVPVSDCNGAYHATRTCTKTFGPLRLGVTVEVNSFSGTKNLRYAWFADVATELKTVFAGVTIHDSFDYAVPTLVGAGIGLDFRMNAVQNSLPGVTSAIPIAKVMNLQADGQTINVTGLGSPWQIDSETVAEAFWLDSAPFGGYGNAFGPSFHFGYDADVAWADGSETSATMQLFGSPIFSLTPWSRTITSPAVGAFVIPNINWGPENGGDGRINAALDLAWSAGQIPNLDPSDLEVHCSRTKPLLPASGPASWSPLEVTIASPVAVLLSTAVWTPTGPVTVIGSAFTVTGGGASVARQLASKWRNWNSIGDPDYHADDLFTTTKHNYYGNANQDVWGWSLYAYLDVTFTCPSNSTLTFTISIATASATPYLFTRTYTKAFPSGTSTQRIDLLFPDLLAGVSDPCFFERVDQIVIAGFNTGLYTLGAVNLVADQQAYLKIAARGGWTGLEIALDGSGPNLLWGQNPLIPFTAINQKDDEDGIFTSDLGTAVTGGCVRMDGTLAATATEFNRMEGVTATDNATAMNADLIDGFGNQIGFLDGVPVPIVPQADWLHVNLPHTRVPANTLTTFAASIPCDTFQIVPAPVGTFVTVWRRTLGMVVESLVTTPALARLAAGARVALQITGGAPNPGSDPVVMVATTDASGYAWAWVRTGNYQGFPHFTVYLTGVS